VRLKYSKIILLRTTIPVPTQVSPVGLEKTGRFFLRKIHLVSNTIILIDTGTGTIPLIPIVMC